MSTTHLPICIAQINPTTGDLQGNMHTIEAAVRSAHAQGARLVLTPELALCGAGVQDLLLRPAFVQACESAVAELARALSDLPDMTLLLGHPSAVADTASGGMAICHNSISVLWAGQCVARYDQQHIGSQLRYFQPGARPCVIDVGGICVSTLISSDIAIDTYAQYAVSAGAQVLLVAGAAAFSTDGVQEREASAAALAKRLGISVVVAHAVGGQDEILHDGASFAVQADGVLAGRAESFVSTLWPVDVAVADTGAVQLQTSTATVPADDAQVGLPPYSQSYSCERLWHALVLGLRDYIRKNGFHSVALGLSGGMDSALVLALAVDALGCGQVRALMMPSPYTADISLADARDMAQRLGVAYDEVPIAPLVEQFGQVLSPLFVGRVADTTEENIQSRIRGTLLMALSNKLGHIILATGNKSEISTGYCTLYGDTAGGFAPIKDVLKTQVYALARWRNQHDPYGMGQNPIPERIITRAPSAELRPDQTDQDSLPPYDVLDTIVLRYMQHNDSIASLLRSGALRAQDIEQVVRLMRASEYKRQQSPLGLRISARGYGEDWRYPLTQRFMESV